MPSRKAQSAIEFMMIVGIAFTMLIPALFIFQQFSSQANEKVISAQVNAFGRELISAAESMYYYGEFSKTTLQFNFPEQITDMSINTPQKEGQHHELVITADVFGAESDFVYFTQVPLADEREDPEAYHSDLDGTIGNRQDAFAPGIKSFKVEAVRRPDTNQLFIAIRRVER